jgi:transposase
MRLLETVQHVTITPLIHATIAPGTCLDTDADDSDSRLEQWGDAQESVCHSSGE